MNFFVFVCLNLGWTWDSSPFSCPAKTYVPLLYRWRDYLQTHGAVPGTLECRKVLYDKLPPGLEWQPLSALHRYTFLLFLLMKYRWKNLDERNLSICFLTLFCRSWTNYLWVYCYHARREDPLCWGYCYGSRQLSLLLTSGEVWPKLPGKAHRYWDATQTVGTCDICGHTWNHREPQTARER